MSHDPPFRPMRAFALLTLLAFGDLGFGQCPRLRRLPRVVPQSAADARISYAPIVAAGGACRGQCLCGGAFAREPQPRRSTIFFPQLPGPGFNFPGRSEQVQHSLGSGVIVDATAAIVTNNHVIEGADQVKVALADRREFEAEIVLADSRSDLAVLRLTAARRAPPRVAFGDSDGSRSATSCSPSAIRSASAKP